MTFEYTNGGGDVTVAGVIAYMRFIKGNLNGLATRLNSQHDLVIQARLASDALALLEGHNYINLETFKKDGRGVVTPVWFMVDGHSVIVITTSDTGKAKRTKNNAAVRIMPSGFSGEPKGDWIKGTARFANLDEMKRAFELRGKKYGSGEGLASSLSSYSRSGRPVAIIITPD